MADPTKEELRSTRGHTAEELDLDRAETVCKFCGVSYLVFSEVKALEKKLKAAEDKVVQLTQQVDSHKAELKKTSMQFKARPIPPIPPPVPGRPA
jgi:hypothetical protein